MLHDILNFRCRSLIPVKGADVECEQPTVRVSDEQDSAVEDRLKFERLGHRVRRSRDHECAETMRRFWIEASCITVGAPFDGYE